MSLTCLPASQSPSCKDCLLKPDGSSTELSLMFEVMCSSKWPEILRSRLNVLPCRSMVQTAEARRLTAFHEAGHALVALNTPGATPIHKATIVPRGHALGMVSMVPHQDEYSITRRQMRAGIDVSMGGRVAEELVFGDDHVRSLPFRTTSPDN